MIGAVLKTESPLFARSRLRDDIRSNFNACESAKNEDVWARVVGQNRSRNAFFSDSATPERCTTNEVYGSSARHPSLTPLCRWVCKKHENSLVSISHNGFPISHFLWQRRIMAETQAMCIHHEYMDYILNPYTTNHVSQKLYTTLDLCSRSQIV